MPRGASNPEMSVQVGEIRLDRTATWCDLLSHCGAGMFAAWFFPVQHWPRLPIPRGGPWLPFRQGPTHEEKHSMVNGTLKALIGGLVAALGLSAMPAHAGKTLDGIKARGQVI